MLIEPSAMRQIQIDWTQIGELISVCLATLRVYKLVAYSTGIVFGDRGKHGIPSCRGGDKVACPPFEAQVFEEAPPPYYLSLIHI